MDSISQVDTRWSVGTEDPETDTDLAWVWLLSADELVPLLHQNGAKLARICQRLTFLCNPNAWHLNLRSLDQDREDVLSQILLLEGVLDAKLRERCGHARGLSPTYFSLY
jgi:hypothetical protein